MIWLFQSFCYKFIKYGLCNSKSDLKCKENTHLYQYSYLALYQLFERSLKWVFCSYMKHKKLKSQWIALSSQNQRQGGLKLEALCNHKDGPSSSSLQWQNCQLAQRNFDPSKHQGFRRVNQESCCHLCGQPGTSIRTIMEAGDMAYTSMTYGHYTRYLPREVLVRILEQALASIQGVNVAKITTDNPH